jgi:hypothetical protein
MRKRLWTVLVAASAAGVLAVCAAPSPAGAAAPACITSFTVIAANDITGNSDEPYMRVRTVFWDPAGSIDDDETVPVNETVHYGDTVQAFDDDWPDPDDYVGSDTVRRGVEFLSFNNGGLTTYTASIRPGTCY